MIETTTIGFHYHVHGISSHYCQHLQLEAVIETTTIGFHYHLHGISSHYCQHLQLEAVIETTTIAFHYHVHGISSHYCQHLQLEAVIETTTIWFHYHLHGISTHNCQHLQLEAVRDNYHRIPLSSAWDFLTLLPAFTTDVIRKKRRKHFVEQGIVFTYCSITPNILYIIKDSLKLKTQIYFLNSTLLKIQTQWQKIAFNFEI